MILSKNIIIVLFLIGLPSVGLTQVLIKGAITDLGNDSVVNDVKITNTFNKLTTLTNEKGEFSITVKKGELIEFKKTNYETVRLRIQNENIKYYKLTMHVAAKEHREAIVREKTFKSDSARIYEEYKLVLDKPKLDEYNTSQGIMAGLSKRTRREWAFQKMYEEEMEQKYIDYMFNEKQLERWTGLKGDDLKLFMGRYKPSYNMLRRMNEYEYLNYLKSCLEMYCKTCQFKVPVFRME